MATPPLLTTIQAARGAAALAVVLCHVGTVLGDPFHGALRAGHAGVDFFFVLSGFIIATVHHADIGRPSRLPAYLGKRLTRIYPLYWTATGVALGLSAGGAASLVQRDPARLLLSLALLPQHTEPVLAVAWTLQHEMLFYLAFALLILNRSIGVAVLAIWAGFVAVTTALTPAGLPWAPADLLRDFVGASYNLEFGLGVAVAVLARRVQVSFPRPVAAMGMAGLSLTGAAEDAGWIPYLGLTGQALFALSAAAVILGLATAERVGAARAGRAAVFVGSASYAIYLIHAPVVIGVGSLEAVRTLPAGAAAAALGALGLSAGLILHVALERPILARLRRAPRPRARQRGPQTIASEMAIEVPGLEARPTAARTPRSWRNVRH